MVVVGWSNMLNEQCDADANTPSTKHLILGYGLVLGGQLVGATHSVLQEVFLQADDYHPFQVLGYEGMFGVVATVAVVLPSVYLIPGMLDLFFLGECVELI